MIQSYCQRMVSNNILNWQSVRPWSSLQWLLIEEWFPGGVISLRGQELMVEIHKQSKPEWQSIKLNVKHTMKKNNSTCILHHAIGIVSEDFWSTAPSNRVWSNTLFYRCTLFAIHNEIAGRWPLGILSRSKKIKLAVNTSLVSEVQVLYLNVSLLVF